MRKQWKQRQTIFLGSKITADGNWSNEIEHLFLERKAMTNLDSTLKSRHITSLTKICLVKDIIFPVVIYGCESCTIKKAEHQKIDTFDLCYWKRHMRVSWTARRSKQSILKEISPEYSLEGLMLKLNVSILWPPDANSQLISKESDARKDWGQRRRGWQDKTVGWHHQIKRCEFE